MRTQIECVADGGGMAIVQSVGELGSLVRKRRRELGMTQKELAEWSGVSTVFLSDLENGKETIQLGKVIEVLTMLSCDLYCDPRG